jgi:hypothetical protein
VIGGRRIRNRRRIRCRIRHAAGHRRGQLPERRTNIGLRGEPGHDLLDLALLQSCRFGEQGLVVRLGEIRREELDRRQVHRTIRETIEDDRELPNRSRGPDPVVRGRLRKSQDVRAVAEQRARTFGTISPAVVEDGEVSDELDGDLARALGQELHADQQVVIRELGGTCEEIHFHVS